MQIYICMYGRDKLCDRIRIRRRVICKLSIQFYFLFKVFFNKTNGHVDILLNWKRKYFFEYVFIIQMKDHQSVVPGAGKKRRFDWRLV